MNALVEPLKATVGTCQLSYTDTCQRGASYILSGRLIFQNPTPHTFILGAGRHPSPFLRPMLNHDTGDDLHQGGIRRIQGV